jgi:hypothetical protein
VAPYRPPGSSPIQRRGERGVVAVVAITNLEVIEHNLEGLTMNIPDATVDELPRHCQRHIVGVSTSIGRLLHRVAWIVVCYNANILDSFVHEAMRFTIFIFWSSDKHFL